MSLHCAFAQGQQTAHAPDVSPEPVAHLSQNRLAALLADAVRSRDLATVVNGCTVNSISQLSHGGMSLHGVNAAGQECRTTCDHLVLADGANSRLR
jgi:2-polyprenyl-6-methoxyphenol hydroxylase-like FAD-dependent oxidoreductase